MDSLPPNNTFSREPNRQKASGTNGFSAVIFLLGVISVFTLCTGIIPITAGALGILFAVLSHRKNTSFSQSELVGLTFCISGFVLGMILVGYTVFTIVIPVMTDPAAYAKWDETLRSLYGYGLEDLIQQYQY